MSDKIIGYKNEHWEQFNLPLSSTDLSRLWHDGDNIYYSDSSLNNVFNKNTRTWDSIEAWNDVPPQFHPKYIWHDKKSDSTYYSEGVWNRQYKLNKATRTWEPVTWNGIQFGLDASYIWYVDDDICCSGGYKLNRDTMTWEPVTWNNNVLTSDAKLKYLWYCDGEVYFSQSGQYKLNKATMTWEPVTWNGFSPSGEYVWCTTNDDGTNDVFYSGNAVQYKLNKATKTWESCDWVTDSVPYFLFSGDSVFVGIDNLVLTEGLNSQAIAGKIYRLVREPVYAKDLPEYLDKRGLATVIEQIKSSSGGAANEFVGTQAEWDALTPEEQNAYSKAYIKKEAEASNEYIGSEEAWNALTAEEQNAYSKAYFV